MTLLARAYQWQQQLQLLLPLQHGVLLYSAEQQQTQSSWGIPTLGCTYTSSATKLLWHRLRRSVAAAAVAVAAVAVAAVAVAGASVAVSAAAIVPAAPSVDAGVFCCCRS